MSKKQTDTIPDDITETISKAYPDYWPLTEQQMYYYLLRKGKLGTEEADLIEYWGLIDNWRLEQVDQRIFINHSPTLESPFLHCQSTKDRKMEYRRHVIENVTAVPDFEIWKDQDIYVELWVDDDALSEFLRLHMNKGVRIPIYNAGHILFPGPLAEAKARLDYMKNIEDKCVVVLYLGDLDSHAYEGYMYRRAAFSGRVDLYDRIGVNREHISRLPPKPPVLDHDNRPKQDRLFQKEIGDNGSYSAHAFEPPKLLKLVSRTVNKYYDMKKYPHERVARWRKAQESNRNSLEAAFDDLLELTV